jgi:HK97 family phage prohead protease
MPPSGAAALRVCRGEALSHQSFDISTLGAPAEFKFVDGEPGSFSGYGSVRHLMDAHGDRVAPGAFAASLAQHKAAGTMPAMFAEHSAFVGGDPLPIGVWTSIDEDAKGLRVKGKLSALDTDHGKRLRSLMQDGALRGLSIGFRVPPGGAVIGTKAGEPKRILNRIDLFSVDVVRDPSNAAALIDNIRSLLVTAQHPAVRAIVSAIQLHHATTAAGDAPTAEERAAMLQHLQDAHMAMTGQPWMKSAGAGELTRPELEALLNNAGLPRAAAKKLLSGGWPALTGSAIETRPAPTPGFAELRARLKQTISDIKSSNRS